MKQKAFFIIFKGPSLNQIKHTTLEGECPTLMSPILNELFHKFWNNKRWDILAKI